MAEGKDVVAAAVGKAANQPAVFLSRLTSRSLSASGRPAMGTAPGNFLSPMSLYREPPRFCLTIAVNEHIP